MTEISVVIPTYNRADKIVPAIRSVLDQKPGDFYISEVLIIDDNSSDNTREVVEAIGDDRVRYHKNPENLGAGGARNKGVELAVSEWIAFQDSDDVWHEDKLAKQTAFHNEHPEYKVIACGYTAFAESGNSYDVLSDMEEDVLGEVVRHNFAGAPAMMTEKKYFTETAGFDISLKALEDWDFALRAAAEDTLGMVNEILLDVYLGSDGVSSDAAHYYESRCRMIAVNKTMLIRKGYFNNAVEELLKDAQKKGILDQVGKILEMYLTV